MHTDCRNTYRKSQAAVYAASVYEGGGITEVCRAGGNCSVNHCRARIANAAGGICETTGGTDVCAAGG